jgi:hypothetical protein
MAQYHLHVSSGSKVSGKGAGGKARYLLRVGPYAKALEHVQEGATVRVVEIDKTDELVHWESGNLPKWTNGDPITLFDASDRYERANGCTYREVEVALPAELSKEEQIALARDFANKVATVEGGVTPWMMAVHEQDPEHPENRHVHILLVDKMLDEFDRTPETFFRQYNRKHPERGGARKTEERRDTKIKDETTGTWGAARWTDRLRPLWAEMANGALERSGLDARIDHRTLDEQRIEQERLADEAKARGDEVAAARHRRQAAILNRPPQPKKGRVLTHAGEEKAPDRAEMMSQYEKAMAEHLSLIEDLQEAERELAEIGRKESILKKAQARQQGRDPSEIRDRWERRQKARQNRQRDAETAAEQRPGIRYPERPQWQVYRERMLTEAYNQDVAQALGRWVRVDREKDGLHIHNQKIDLMDRGDRITVGMGGNDKEIDAMLQLARAKGWKKLEFTGSQDFQERAAAAALAAGFDLTDTALKGRILDKQRLKEVAEAGKEQAREAFERFKAEQVAKRAREEQEFTFTFKEKNQDQDRHRVRRDYDLSR